MPEPSRSSYGASIAAVPASTTPSANNFTVRTETWSATDRDGRPASGRQERRRAATGHRSGSARSAMLTRTAQPPGAGRGEVGRDVGRGQRGLLRPRSRPAAANSAVERATASSRSCARRAAARAEHQVHRGPLDQGPRAPSRRRRRAIVAGGRVGGAGVDAARRSASVFTQSSGGRSTAARPARSGTAASSHAASNRAAGHERSGRRAPPWIQPAPGASSALRDRRAATSSVTVVASRTCGPRSSTPPHSGCTCPSPKDAQHRPALEVERPRARDAASRRQRVLVAAHDRSPSCTATRPRRAARSATPVDDDAAVHHQVDAHRLGRTRPVSPRCWPSRA